MIETILIVVVCLFLTVSLHELGHMLAALALGVKVEAFCLGFGKPLLHKKLWGIDFRLAPIPLGGYCRLEGEKSKTKSGWLTKGYSKKLIIILAGITVNLLIACVCYLINYGSIKLGLFIDFKLIQYTVTKDYESIYRLIAMATPNAFLLQLGLMNLFAFITNALPIPALDGSYVWLFPLERLYKERFPVFLDRITKIGFVFLIVLQVALMYWIWCV